MSLKALANRRFSWDNERDNSGTIDQKTPEKLSHTVSKRIEPVGQLRDASITVPCARCGAPSRPFLAIINPDLWQCDTCLPADPNDEAYGAIERQAIIAEGRPAEPVLIAMPVSWADASLIPTPGARCRNCNGRSWWTDRRGWRCSRCHPPCHPETVREVRT